MTRCVFPDRPIGKIPKPLPIPWGKPPRTALIRKPHGK
jgi:hypothetical protein